MDHEKRMYWIPSCNRSSFASSWQRPLANAEIFTSAHISPTLSLMSNPRSARTTSPGSNFCRSPQFSDQQQHDCQKPPQTDVTCWLQAMSPWPLHQRAEVCLHDIYGICERGGHSQSVDAEQLSNMLDGIPEFPC
ncbi:hypothetical protein CHARACLAT_008668 [Characodon lateralis]|uniref:Uncharacterized protein n=1 Tax=Characodon lateralis TaxID=208331 RepID=A0ABU7DF47_9TELE|nr:hypothetical protein [Characodon lateralis]